MTSLTTRALVLTVLETFTTREQLTDQDTLEALGLDSLDRVQLAIDLERRLGIDIPDPELDQWTTVGDVVTGVQTRVGL